MIHIDHLDFKNKEMAIARWRSILCLETHGNSHFQMFIFDAKHIYILH
jgi:hypothetical protein